jgi:hypothetical protein
MTTSPSTIGYPVSFHVDPADGPRDRKSVALRIFLVIPIAIVLATVSGTTFSWARDEGAFTAAGAGGTVFAAPVLMILFRQKYPRWWFDWNLALWRFENRVAAYVLLLRDEYPSTDEEQAVHLDADHPDVVRDLNRWLPLVKWFLAIPHYVVLLFVNVGALFVVIYAWFAILFTGRLPGGVHDFVTGVMRWDNRVIGYAFTLVTDRYPPFRLAP